MDNKIFLQSFKSKKSVNTSEGLNISLKGKRKLLPTNDIAEVVSAYDVYREEREKCNKIRLACQVNTICSNILFNSITEVVENEGSPNLSFLNYGIINGESGGTNIGEGKELYYKVTDLDFWQKNNVQEAIRDTQLSNFGYVYHCGVDIFNNHLIRSNTFKPVCQLEGKDVNSSFNTINDTLRNEKGEVVEDRVYFPISSGLSNRGESPRLLHLYKYDDLYSYKECVEKRLVTSFEGWVGFRNKSKIKTYQNYEKSDEKTLNIDRPIMYLNGGDFVDMYPDRSLYSFVPKYNTYKNRVEKNWNYCLTYPSSSTTEGFDDIIQTTNNSLKAIYFNENTIADNGVRQLVVYSIAKHGLSVGDTVNIYNTVITENGSGEIEKNTELVLSNAKVTAIADDYIFTVFSTVQLSKYWVEVSDEEYTNKQIVLSDLGTFNLVENRYFIKGTDTSTKYYIIDGTNYVNLDDNAQNISYKKVVNGIECDYYVRIFSRLPNFKNASADTSSQYEIYKDNGKLIQEYQQKKYEHESHVSRLAFAKNAYSDDIGEIVFTDDIDISNLKDNLGRPLSSIYLTIVKNNAGYKEWYGFDCHKWSETEITKNNVEYSHCFGSITCGIQTSEESKFDNTINSINKINRITISGISESAGFNVDMINGGDRDAYDSNDEQYENSGHSENYDIMPNEVWFNLDRNYYGDLSYYDNYNAVERHIQPILHRFNTAQRESMNASSDKFYENFKYDEIKHDDYDYLDFEVESTTTNQVNGCNSRKEGYYYNPHYEIRIKSFDKLEMAMPDFLTISKINVYNDSVRFTTLEQHHLSIGDKAMLYDIVNNQYYYCEAISGFQTSNNSFICKIYDENSNIVYPFNIFKDSNMEDRPIEEFNLFKLDNLDIPSYARILKDGTCRVIWRNVVNNGFNMSDKSIEEYPFTNGAFYINMPINLYVKRQDPYNFWGLYSSEDLSGADINTDEEDNYVKDTYIEC